MPKFSIHPNWFTNIPIYYDRQPLCRVNSTKRQLQVDIWLANHPFYNNSKTIIDSKGRVEKACRRIH